MSSQPEAVGLFALEGVRQLMEEWVEGLGQVVLSMTDQKPLSEWKAIRGAPAEVAPEADAFLWWEQPFRGPSGLTAWVGTPQSTWEFTGTLTLKAAGLETIEPAEARNTWLEVLGQSLSVMARSIGSFLGQEVTCEAGAERVPGPEVQEWASFTVRFGETTLAPLLLAISQPLAKAISAPTPNEIRAASSPAPNTSDIPQELLRSRTMGLLFEIDLPVSISFGKAHLPMKDVLKLTTGSIVELNRGINEQVDVLVNHCLIARGEVVVVDGNYGVRIQEIASRQDRLRSLR
jgi:flagellar motor switch protein FliN/FliY